MSARKEEGAARIEKNLRFKCVRPGSIVLTVHISYYTKRENNNNNTSKNNKQTRKQNKKLIALFDIVPCEQHLHKHLHVVWPSWPVLLLTSMKK